MIRKLCMLGGLFALASLIALGCNLSGGSDLEGPECEADDECVRGICVDFECVDCLEDDDCHQSVCYERTCVQCSEDEHCPGDDICEQFWCESGCARMDCGSGTCVDDNGSLYCECDDGYLNDEDDPTLPCTCAVTDTPDPVNFTDGNCDGLDGDASRAIFVSINGSDGNDGAPARPVRTITRGVELAANDSERDHVYIGDGEFVEPGPIRLEDNVSIFGGFHDSGTSLEEWERGPGYETILRVEEGLTDHRPLEIVGNTQDVEVQLLTVVAGDGNLDNLDGEGSFAGSSVGIMVYNNLAHVEISHVDVVTGRGMHGRDGSVGEQGEEGDDGLPAPDPGGTSYGDFGDGAPDNPEVADPSNPVELACQYGEGRSAPGRAGGSGGFADGSGSAGGSIIISGGSDITGGGGGDAETDEECAGSDQSGSRGERGDSGQVVGEIGGPAPATESVPRLVEGATVGNARAVFHGASGNRGEGGGAGQSGAGGGGGGGVYLPWGAIGCQPDFGGGGGAGGLGGCGGQGGEGGEFGGASIGILIYASPVTITAGSVTTDVGGDGGDGAIGGPGGEGGSGGLYAHGRHPSGSADSSRRGGSGGDGADGGRGGPGGGGEGGPSFGIAYGAIGSSEVDIDDEIEFDIGRGGEGGSGAEDAGDGPDGLHGEIYPF